MRGREDKSFSSISSASLSVRTLSFLSAVLLLRPAATDIINKTLSRIGFLWFVSALALYN